MRTYTTVLLLTSCAFSWSKQSMAGSAKDQASNVARQEKEQKTPVDVKFFTGQKQGSGPIKQLEGDNIKFTLKGVNLSGNIIFATSELSAIWKPYLNKETTMAEIQAVAQKITQHYRTQGYEVAQVLLPAQHIDPAVGIVDLQVLEGILGSVRVEGGSPEARKLVEDQLDGLPIGKPFNTNELEKRLLNIRRTPGLTIQPVLVPSETTIGNTDLVFKIGKQRYTDGSLSHSSTGNRFTGLFHGGADMVAYNLLGRSKTSAGYLRSMRKDFLNFYRVRQTQLLGNDGTRAYVEYMASKARPRIPFLNRSNYTYANIMLMHPLIYKRDQNLRVRFAIDGQNDASTYDGNILKNDHVRAARLGLLYSLSGDADFWEFSGVISKGFNKAFGARKTEFPSRFGGKNNFRHVTGRATWVHKINNQVSLFNMVGLQHSYDPLLATEEFAVGGSNYVRGYESTESSADCGFGALTEVRVNTATPVSWMNSLQFYTSFGGAKVRNHKQKVDSLKKESLASFAMGVRGTVFEYFDYTLQAGKPLSRRSSIKADKKWKYVTTLGLRFDLSKDWDQSVKADDDPLASVDD